VTIRVLIADDQKIMRDGLHSMIGKRQDMEVVGEAGNGRETVRLAAEIKPDVIIMDISMPDLNGIDAAREITQSCPGVKVVALSMYPHRKLVLQMLEAGATAYVLKDCAFDELSQAILAVSRNRTYLSPGVSDILIEEYIRKSEGSKAAGIALLTPREREVLQLIAEGKTTPQIAERLHLSQKTVETHRQNVMSKLDIHTIAGLTKLAIREGLTSVDS
jgi:two-component system response regulator NreC